MTPLPVPIGPGGVRGWRLDQQDFAATWDSGEGAFRFGGKWNSRGVRAVYAALDPATAIIEVAVHKTFRVLDTVPHVLTAFNLLDPLAVHVVEPQDVPDATWLRPGIPNAEQQGFGDALLGKYAFVAIPSSVSAHSWNLVFVVGRGAPGHRVALQEAFVLDPRLHRAGR